MEYQRRDTHDGIPRSQFPFAFFRIETKKRNKKNERNKKKIMPPDKIKSLWLFCVVVVVFFLFCVSSVAVNAERECTAERNVHTSHCFAEEEETH